MTTSDLKVDLRPQEGHSREFLNVLSSGPEKWIFVQQELSFVENHELFSVMGEAFKDMFQTSGGLRSVFSIIDRFRNMEDPPPDQDGNPVSKWDAFSVQMVDGSLDTELEGIIGDIFSLLMNALNQAPHLLIEVMMVFLGVNPINKDQVRPSIQKIPNDLGFEIIRFGLVDNRGSLISFFGEWASIFKEAFPGMSMRSMLNSEPEPVESAQKND